MLGKYHKLLKFAFDILRGKLGTLSLQIFNNLFDSILLLITLGQNNHFKQTEIISFDR